MMRNYAEDVPRVDIVAELEAAVAAALDPSNLAPTIVRNAAVTRITLLPKLERDELDLGLMGDLACANDDLWKWWADEFKPAQIRRELVTVMGRRGT